MFNWKSETVNNALIQLGELNETEKGRHFKSRFIQAGIAGYPNQFGNVLITKETLDKFVTTLIGKPVIINHKDEITEDDKVGEVTSVWFNPEDGWFWCEGYLTDETAINLIKDKNWSVSCSYDVLLLDDEGGTENNVKYDQEFLNGVFTHLAIVENPRYERANIVVNSKTVIINDAEFESKHPRDEQGRFAETSYSKYFLDTTTGMSMYDDVLKDEHYAEIKQRFPKIVKMSPDKYIETVLDGFNSAYKKYGNEEYIKTKEQLIKSRETGLDKLREKFGKVQLDMPIISYEMQEDKSLDMGAQEGLHRAIIAKEQGLNEIPVAIYTTARYGAKIPNEELKEALKNITDQFNTNEQNNKSNSDFIKKSANIKPIKINKSNIPNFNNKKELSNWVKSEFEKLGSVKIDDTGIELVLSSSSTDRETIKRRALKEQNRAVFSIFKDIVKTSIKKEDRDKDERHIKDQEVYYNKFQIEDGDNIEEYEVEIFADKPYKDDNNTYYAGHKASKIKVTPRDTQVVQNNLSLHTKGVNYIIPNLEINLNPNVTNQKQTFEEAFTDVFFEALAEVLLESKREK